MEDQPTKRMPGTKVQWTYAQRRPTCRYGGCMKQITSGEPVFITAQWRWKAKGYFKRYYHPECYLKAAMEHFDKNPFVRKKSKGGGRRRLDITDADRARRKVLGDIFHKLVEEGGETVIGDPRLAEIKQELQDVAREMDTIGGVPNKWRTYVPYW